MSAIKYLISIITFTALARACTLSSGTVALGYCVLTAGWIACGDKRG